MFGGVGRHTSATAGLSEQQIDACKEQVRYLFDSFVSPLYLPCGDFSLWGLLHCISLLSF
jgi:hypothetical protein